MHYEASSDSGKTNNSMQFQPIELQLASNWHAGYNLMATIAGSPCFDSYLYSQKLPFLNLSFRHYLFFMHNWDWTSADIGYRLFAICPKLPALMIPGGWELARHRLSSGAETGI